MGSRARQPPAQPASARGASLAPDGWAALLASWASRALAAARSLLPRWRLRPRPPGHSSLPSSFSRSFRVFRAPPGHPLSGPGECGSAGRPAIHRLCTRPLLPAPLRPAQPRWREAGKPVPATAPARLGFLGSCPTHWPAGQGINNLGTLLKETQGPMPKSQRPRTGPSGLPKRMLPYHSFFPKDPRPSGAKGQPPLPCWKMIGWTLWRPGATWLWRAFGAVPGTLASLPLMACGSAVPTVPTWKSGRDTPACSCSTHISAPIAPFMGVPTFLQPRQTLSEQLATTLLSFGLNMEFPPSMKSLLWEDFLSPDFL